MNANEVISTLASCQFGQPVHPNDHVNCSQSSNDVIPTTIEQLVPALQKLVTTIGAREQDLGDTIKVGRTHLMDAMPLSLAQELSGWRSQLSQAEARIADSRQQLRQLAQGGTAIGTGINAERGFAQVFCRYLSAGSAAEFRPADNFFAAIGSQDVAVAVSGQLRALAVALMKISNDLRWMNSGPLAGLGEVAQVMGNDTTIGIAGQSGNFQLNVMLPVIAYNLLQSIQLLAASCHALAEHCIANFEVNVDTLKANLTRNPILVTAMNRRIGYARAAEIAKRAYSEGRPVLEVAMEMTDLSREELAELLDPRKMV
jgi:fumarate hydratase class II